MGRHAEAVSELTALTAAHPLRERLRELLMLALYRSGRQAEALAVFADTRRLLADELGVDPGPDSPSSSSASCARTPDSPRRAVSGAAGRAAPVRPAQFPATVPDFTGRTVFVNELSDVLSSAGGRVWRSPHSPASAASARPPSPCTSRTPPPAFPDGQLYVDLQGTSPAARQPG